MLRSVETRRSSSSPAGVPVCMQDSTLDRERWESEVDTDLHSSSHGAAQLLGGTTSSTSHASTVAGTTGTYDTDTGTDFGLLGSYSQGEPSWIFRTFGLFFHAAADPVHLTRVCSP